MGRKKGHVKRKGNGRLHQSCGNAQIKVRLNLFYQPELAHGATWLDPIESAHALRVLRLQPGEKIEVTDGVGGLYKCTIANSKKGQCNLTIDDRVTVARPHPEVHLALAPTKNHDRIEWLVEKATEIGVHTISFFVSDRSERKKINEERLQKIAISAMKQSLKAWLPSVGNAVPFATVLKFLADQKFIAHLGETPSPYLIDTSRRGNGALVLIGPEGDFSSAELDSAIKAGFLQVSLGPHRLRTETAAFAAAHELLLANRWH